MSRELLNLACSAGALLALALGGAGCGALRAERWLFDLIDPGEFEAARTPVAPDYGRVEAWAALPELEDGADVHLSVLPTIDQQRAQVSVFYLHPTTWMGRHWNGPWDDPLVVEGTTRGGTLIQASVFNGCCAVYAPRYRQAHGRAYTEPDEQGDEAIDVAYADVSTAFDAFLARVDGEHGIIVAGHSQGSVLAARLLRERVAGAALQERLVAAYLPGGPVRTELVGGLPTCADPLQTGCVVAYNARGPSYQPNGLEYDAADPDTMKGRICVNPLSWHDATAHAPRSANAGAVFFDTPKPHVKRAFADAQCVEGALVVSELGDPERDLASRLLLRMMGPEGSVILAANRCIAKFESRLNFRGIQDAPEIERACNLVFPSNGRDVDRGPSTKPQSRADAAKKAWRKLRRDKAGSAQWPFSAVHVRQAVRRGENADRGGWRPGFPGSYVHRLVGELLRYSG